LRTVAESGSSTEESKDGVIHLDRFLDTLCVVSCWQDAMETRDEGRGIVENTLRAGLDSSRDAADQRTGPLGRVGQ
jgi:hypothetical protein